MNLKEKFSYTSLKLDTVELLLYFMVLLVERVRSGASFSSSYSFSDWL